MGRKNRRMKERKKPVKNIAEMFPPRRMEVWFARLPFREHSSIQGGSRPVLIVSNDICNRRSPVVTVIPMTTVMKHTDMPTHVPLTIIPGRESMLLTEQITSLQKTRLVSKMGTVEDEAIEKIEKAICIQVGIGEENDELPG